MRSVAVIVLVSAGLWACQSKQDKQDTQAKQDTPAAGARASESDRVGGLLEGGAPEKLFKKGCARELHDYIRALEADGEAAPSTGDIQLVTIQRPPQSISTTEQFEQVRLPADLTGDAIAIYGAQPVSLDTLRNDLMLPQLASTPVELQIDRRVPWRIVNNVMHVISPRKIRFVFAAGGRAQAEPPEASSIDEKVAAIDKDRRKLSLTDQLSNDPFPPISVDVYKNCAEAREAWRSIVSADDRVAAIRQLLPDAVGACGCNVELAAAKRLLWRLWGRDGGSPLLTHITVDVSDGLTLHISDDAQWSEAAQLVVAAVR